MSARLLKVRDSWEDQGDNYIEIKIGKYEACCIKRKKNGLIYILQCDDGNEVYSNIAGSDFPLRKASKKEETEILEFAKKIDWRKK